MGQSTIRVSRQRLMPVAEANGETFLVVTPVGVTYGWAFLANSKTQRIPRGISDEVFRKQPRGAAHPGDYVLDAANTIFLCSIAA